jgi:general secretion pathway protein I
VGRPQDGGRHTAAGFTLIEIVVAMAVLAIAMGAILSGMTRYADNAAYLRQKTVALWIAHNRLSEIQLEPTFPKVGNSDGDVTMAGGDWRWFVTVLETPDPSVHRVQIRVQVKGRDADVAHLTAFLSSIGKQVAP